MGILETTGTLYEPKKENRWIVYLPEKFEISKWVTNATNRPKIIIDEKTGQVTCEPIRIKFNDPIAESTTIKLWDLFIANSNNNFDYKLEMIDPTGEVVERWEFKGCKVIEVDFGELDYSSDKNAKCSILIKPSQVLLHF
jgi:hypothetical protein